MAEIFAILAGYAVVRHAIEFADGSPNIDLYGSTPEGDVIFLPNGRTMAMGSRMDR
jgi:hypothetical protein